MLKKLYSLIFFVVLTFPFQAQAVNLDKDVQSVVIITASNTNVFDKTKKLSADEQLKVKIALGAGFFIDKHHIMTANHVVKDMRYIHVTMKNGDDGNAKVVAVDQLADLAILKVDLEGVPLKFSSQKPKLGETVWAIGHPHSYPYSVSKGIVSNTLVIASQFTNAPLIQVDAAINEGNSGGPIINDNDEVLGIADFIDSESKESNGLGFCVRYDFSQRMAESVLEHGFYKRIVFHAIYNQRKDKIIFIEMQPGSIGARYLKPQDQLLSINNYEIKDAADVMNSTVLLNPTSPVTVKVLRDGKVVTLLIPNAEIH